MRHLLSIEDLDRGDIERICDRARSFAEVGRRDIKKVPTLRGRTIVSLFYEASTRTSSSFELAAKRLSADVVSVKSVGSSVDKGESLRDTIATLSAYEPEAIVIRSPEAGAAALVAGWTEAAVVNAGDGKHEHPSQALLDVYTLIDHVGPLDGKRIWIVGDVAHSRVARSCIRAFVTMGAEVTVAGPPTLIPRGIETLGCEVAYDLDDLGEADVIYALRMQKERMKQSFVPSLREYADQLPDQRPPARAAAAGHAPGPGQPRRRALARGDRRPRLADHRPGRERPARADGDPLRDPRRRRAAAAAEPDRRRRPRPRRARARRSESRHERPSATRSARSTGAATATAGDLLIRGRPRASIRAPASTASATSSSATAGSPRSPTPAPASCPRAARRSTPPACTPSRPSSTRTSTCARPGRSTARTSSPGTRAAAAGGFCGIVAMANTDPVVDDPAIVAALRERAATEATVPTGFVATVTRGMAGRELTEMAALREAGAVGFSDDGLPITDAGVMRRALQYQHLVGGTILLHEEDPALTGDGVMGEGAVSAALGLAGVPDVSESTMIARDGALCLYEDARAHVQHLSARTSVEAVAVGQGGRRDS